MCVCGQVIVCGQLRSHCQASYALGDLIQALSAPMSSVIVLGDGVAEVPALPNIEHSYLHQKEHGQRDCWLELRNTGIATMTSSELVLR